MPTRPLPCCDSASEQGWDLFSSQMLPREQQKNKKVFLSPEEFQNFEMWFGANLTGKSKLSADNFGVVTSKDVSKY